MDDELKKVFEKFNSELEAEINSRVAAAVDPLKKEIAELTERILCLEQVHEMTPADYAKPDEDDEQ